MSNAAIDIADEASRTLIMDFLLEEAIKLAIKEVPWLAAPFINPIFLFIMKFAAKFLYKKVSLEAALFIIGKQVEHQRVQYEAEVAELKTAIKEGKSDEEIKKQREEAKERLRKLINFNDG